jgi:phosphoglycolate phosphatase-like HAD superfamily hydrolase
MLIKSVIFDFDGVLIESAGIKTGAFRRLVADLDETIREDFVQYHVKNSGISRFVKFRYLYEELLRKPYSERAGFELSERFSALVLDQVKAAPLVEGTKEFLLENRGRRLLFIASGTPERELVDTVFHKEISEYFVGMFGTPTTKPDIINSIKSRYRLKSDEIAFVGDGQSDLEAGQQTGVHFILRATSDNAHFTASARHIISNLKELGSILEGLES